MSQAVTMSSRSPGRLGTRVCGFQIVEQIAEGNGATVYRAHDDKRDVAVKIYERGDEARPTIDPRALVESAAQGLVQHPAVAKLIDATLLADGSYCLVSDWIHGVPLTAVIAEAPSWERVRKIVESINAGLGAIHTAGVIHRDLSAENILAPRAQSPAAVIIDFSNALVLDGVRATRTASTPGHAITAYTSPEQLAGLPLDARADLYALGVVLYELLTGVKPATNPEAAPLESTANLESTPKPESTLEAAPLESTANLESTPKPESTLESAPLESTANLESAPKLESKLESATNGEVANANANANAIEVGTAPLAITPPRARAPQRDIPVVAEELCMWLLATDRDARVPSSRVLAVTLGALAADTNGGLL